MQEYITVSQLNSYIKRIFDSEEMLHNIPLLGEVYGVSFSRNVIYFSLKDESATIPCVCFYPANAPQIVGCGKLVLDHASKTCKIGDEEIPLTKKEFDLLYLFLSNKNKIFSREEIMEKIWEKNIYVVDRTIDVNINRLRKKLGVYESKIVTRQGYGYGFKESV